MSGKGSISRMSDECLMKQETAFPFYVVYQAVMRKFTLAGKSYCNDLRSSLLSLDNVQARLDIVLAYSQPSSSIFRESNIASYCGLSWIITIYSNQLQDQMPSFL